MLVLVRRRAIGSVLRTSNDSNEASSSIRLMANPRRPNLPESVAECFSWVSYSHVVSAEKRLRRFGDGGGESRQANKMMKNSVFLFNIIHTRFSYISICSVVVVVVG